MRLIDADALIKIFEGLRDEHETLAISYVALYEVLVAMPTAYNVDAVIAELEKEKAKGFYDSDSVIGEKNVWNKAIDIVRNAGKDGAE